jgi:hypothetical protein
MKGKHNYELIVDKPDAIIPILQNSPFVLNVDKSDDRILIQAKDVDQLGQRLPKILVDAKVQLVKFAPTGESLQDIFLQIMGETKNGQKQEK